MNAQQMMVELQKLIDAHGDLPVMFKFAIYMPCEEAQFEHDETFGDVIVLSDE